MANLQATCYNLQVVHVGRTCVTKLAKDLGRKHSVWSSDNYRAQVFFENALCTVKDFDQSIDYAMIISDVVYKDNHKTFSRWTSVTLESVKSRAKEMDFQNIEYLRFKELIETGQRSNLEVLRQLLLTKDIKFLVSSTKQVDLKELEGKCVFLLLSWLHNMKEEYKAFKNVHEKLLNDPNRKNVQFEVVWIPIVIEGRVTRALHAEMVEEIQWPSIADPWSINPMVMRYFKRYITFDKLPCVLAVSPSGRFYPDNLIPSTTRQEAAIDINAIEAQAKAEMKEKGIIEEMIAKEVRNRVKKQEDEIRSTETIEALIKFIETTSTPEQNPLRES